MSETGSDTGVVNRAIIREARPEDDFGIGELLVDAYITKYAQKMPEVVYTEERKRSLRDVAAKREIAAVLVAEVEGEVAGTVALFPPGAPGSEAWTPNTADLRHLATAVRYHGTGLSRPLLDAAEDLARKWGVDAVALHVRKGNAGVAAMYRKRGYVRTPEGDLELPTVSLEAYLLRLKG
jgi:GNAT superfamily N-acetyltransferase